MENIAKQINELKDKINKWADSYYLDNVSLVSDDIYNQHYYELERLERAYPSLRTEDSPTNRVLGGISDGLVSMDHDVPMLSLKTETDCTEQGAKDFCKRIKDELGEDVEYIAEMKYDGLGLDLIYVNRRLVKAITRGDGDTGENVLHNVKRFTNIQLTLPPNAPNYFNVRGEVVMLKQSFNSINILRESTGLKKYANPRNAAAGLLRTIKEPDIKITNKLAFLAYQIVDKDEELSSIRSQSRVISFLSSMGFVSGLHTVVNTAKELWNFHELISKSRNKLEYEIDGVVYKVNQFYLQKKLGFIAREPRWAIAHKFPPVEAVSTIETIDVQVGRTGAITPVARITPVYVGGVTVSNVTLHNVFDLRSRGVRAGDKVIVRRAGDVIPEIVKDPSYKRTSYVPNFSMEKICPICGNPTQRVKGERKYYCTGGILCEAQAKELYNHFVSRSAMRIDGVGNSVVELLMKAGLLKDFTSFYVLKKEDLVGLEGIEDKKATNIIAAIERSKKVKLSKFIYALGIRHVGEETANDLANHFRSLDAILNAQLEDILEVRNIGEITARSLYEYTQNEDNVDIINGLILHGIEFEGGAVGDILKEKSFAVTGSFENMERNKIKDLIINNGGKFDSSIGKKTSYLIAGEGGGEKRTKAESMRIPVIDLNKFLEMLK